MSSQQTDQQRRCVPVYRNTCLGDDQNFFGFFWLDDCRGVVHVTAFDNCVTTSIRKAPACSNFTGGEDDIIGWLTREEVRIVMSLMVIITEPTDPEERRAAERNRLDVNKAAFRAAKTA